MLDELACLTRDLLVLQTAPQAGMTMLSGVSEGGEAAALAQAFSGAELVRMLSVLQQTMAGFVRSASRRMDAELCIVNLCRPELSLDAQSLNARLARLEEQIQSGNFAVAQPVVAPQAAEEELPPPPEDRDALPAPQEMPVEDDLGFWPELVAAIRREKLPCLGFFTTAQNAPVQGALQGDTLILRCESAFTLGMINKPEVLELVARKASAQMARQIRVKAVDASAAPAQNEKMARLLSFGEAHSDIVKIKK